EYSRMFKTTIGVKQGGPLSPRLFAIYLEDLVESIDQLNLGVKVGKMLINIVLYADDILLMAESSDDLQTLANTTMEFGEKWQIKYNPSKTVLMAFGMPKKDKNKAIKVEFEK
ncbi:RNA-directed DNA polymerase from mobile element jockey-like, partial [Brachionus plicatilis]